MLFDMEPSVSEEAIAGCIVYVVMAVATRIFWGWLSGDPSRKLPPELQFRLWAPKGAEIPFAVLVGILCPISFFVLLAWCFGWFIVVGGAGLIADLRRLTAERRRLSVVDTVPAPAGGE